MDNSNQSFNMMAHPNPSLAAMPDSGKSIVASDTSVIAKQAGQLWAATLMQDTLTPDELEVSKYLATVASKTRTKADIAATDRQAVETIYYFAKEGGIKKAIAPMTKGVLEYDAKTQLTKVNKASLVDVLLNLLVGGVIAVVPGAREFIARTAESVETIESNNN